ncbi:MAG: prepilin-type N-terminal cleavage/methylation domain-containing protein [Candidatus Saccharimonadales bacterium]
MKELSSSNKSQSGFTLVELLVAMSIFSLITVGIFQLFIAIDSMQRRTQRIEVATRAAEAKIESLRNNHYNSLEPDTTIVFTDELPDELPEPRSAEVNITEETPGLKQLEVTITYAQRPQDKTIVLTGVMGSIGISQ